jgi:hypothetical protein
MVLIDGDRVGVHDAMLAQAAAPADRLNFTTLVRPPITTAR